MATRTCTALSFFRMGIDRVLSLIPLVISRRCNIRIVHAGDAMRVAVNIVLDPKEHQLLRRLSQSRSTSVRLAGRSTIVLLAAEGKTNEEIAEQLRIFRQKVRHWRDRYHCLGFRCIEKNAPRSGRKEFQEKLEDAVGWLYLAPPENPTVLSCNEKSPMQVLDRTQPGFRIK